MIFLLSALASALPILTAAQIEMDRALTELSLPNQPKAYWIGYHIEDLHYQKAYSSSGSLLLQDEEMARISRIDIRVGDLSFDNRNFNSFSSNQGIIHKSLPTENDLTALRRELWLGIDKAYKGAVEGYAEKEAAFEGRDYPERDEMLPITVMQTEGLSLPPPKPWVAGIANDISSVLAGYDFLEDNTVVVFHKSSTEHILTSEGHSVSQPKDISIIRMEVETRAEDGSTLRNLRSWVVQRPEDLPSVEEMQTEAMAMAEWLERLQNAPIEEDYLGPVIFEEEAAVELFRQLLLNQLSATPPPSEAPDFSGEIPRVIPSSRLGRRLLPRGWVIVDDAPAQPDAAGSYLYDSQGVPPKAVTLVEDGIVRDLLMSRIPREGFAESSGHGRAMGRDRRVAINSVTTVTPKKNRSMKALRRKGGSLARQTGLDYVLVVKRLEPLALTDNFEIAFSGDGPLSGLTLPVEAYRLYPDGTEIPIRGAAFVGVDRRVLRDIAIAGPQSDLTGLMDDHYGRYGLGNTGGIPVSWSVPSVLITEMEIRGQGGQELRVIPKPQ